MYHTGNLWLVITLFCDHVVTMQNLICLRVVVNQNLILTYLLGAVTLVVLAHPLQCVPMRGQGGHQNTPYKNSISVR